MPYKILCWIPVEEEEPQIHGTRSKAQKEYEQLSFLQPENIYRIVRVPKKELPDKAS